MAVFNGSALPDVPASFQELADISFFDFVELITPFAYFVVGIVVYAIFVFKFYHFLARRDLLQLHLHQYSKGFTGFLKSFAYITLYTLENLILIPITIFTWFAVLMVLLLLLTKTYSPEALLLTASSLVAAIRITAHYNQYLSMDLAKMIPFALLAIFLIDASFFSIENSIAVAKQIPSLWKLFVYYLAFVVLLEFALRVLHALWIWIKPKQQQMQGTVYR